MTTTLLKHGSKCGGHIVMDISNMFVFSSPGISLSPEGISAGAVEIRENPDRGKPVLKCGKCGEEVNLADEKSVQASCSVCRRNRNANTLFVSFQFPCICESCIAVLEGRETTESKTVLETLSYFLIPPGTIKFVSLAEILSKSL